MTFATYELTTQSPVWFNDNLNGYYSVIYDTLDHLMELAENLHLMPQNEFPILLTFIE